MQQIKKMIGLVMAVASLSLTAGTALADAVTHQADKTPRIMGHWHSAGVENYGQVFATRQFEVAHKTWGVTFRTFADAQGKQPMFTIRVKGFYVVGGPSDKVSGAFEGIFPAYSRSITAESPDGVKMFAEMGCQLELGKARALAEQACGFVPSLMQNMGEYDLVALKDGKLFFGDRSGDLAKARPYMLTPYALVRQHGFK